MCRFILGVAGLAGRLAMGGQMKRHLKALMADERGSAAAEYALLLAIIGTSIALAASTLGGAISSSIISVVASI